MNAESEALLDAALQLPLAERQEFLGRLIEAVPVGDATWALDDPGLLEELDRRFADRAGAVPWEELRRED